ncbi:MAG TPA: hypothetical protein ENG03_06285 [Thioploca sp.]|nr:MAG: hypothetical protein DRR08_06485 [Gammaproteobacteria bacterium]HDN26693.1 hypothetical protein [Thioploca sp.]
MSIVKQSTKPLNLNGLSFTPIRRHKRSKPRPIYYKTECLDCDLILGVRLEREYVGALPTRRRTPQQKSCPFCEGTRTSTLKINEKEYIEINQQWDIVDLSETGDENLNDWSSWIV